MLWEMQSLCLAKVCAYAGHRRSESTRSADIACDIFLPVSTKLCDNPSELCQAILHPDMQPWEVHQSILHDLCYK